METYFFKKYKKYYKIYNYKICIIIYITKYADNTRPKKVIMTNKMVKQASKCANCKAKKSRFLKQKTNRKTAWNKIDPKLLIYETQVIIKHVVMLFEMQK